MVSAVTQYVCVRARAYSISTANQARPRNSVHRLTFAHQISVLLGAKGFKVNATGSQSVEKTVLATCIMF